MYWGTSGGGNIVITDCIFKDSSFFYEAIAGFYYGQTGSEIPYVIISDCLFLENNVTNNYGTIVNFAFLGTNTTKYITNCTFHGIRRNGLLSTAIRGTVVIRVCNLFKSKSIFFDYEKKYNGFFRFISTCKSVIRNNKSILAINALLICQRLPRFFQVCPFFIMAR